MSQSRAPFPSVAETRAAGAGSAPAPAADAGRGDALRQGARGLPFEAGAALLRPGAQGPAGASAPTAPAAAPGAPEAALGLTRGTAPNEALRGRVTADYQRGNELLAAGQYHGAIATHSALYALPDLTPTVRFKLCFEIALGHAGLGNHETALSFLREAQGMPGVAGELRASGSAAMADIHRDMARGRGTATEAAGGGSAREALDRAISAGAAAFHAGQLQAAHDHFMRAFVDRRAVGRLPDARGSAIMNAGMCKVRLGAAAEGLRLIQDGLAVAGISGATRLGGFDLMRAAQLAASRRTAGTGQGSTRGDATRLFDEASATIASGAWARALDTLMDVYTGPAWSLIEGDARGAFVFNIAVCHQRLGRRDEALTWFQNALDRHAFHSRGATAEAIRALRVEDATRAAQTIAPAPMRAPAPATGAPAQAPTEDREPRLSLVPATFDEAPQASPATGGGASGGAVAALALTPDDFHPHGQPGSARPPGERIA